MSNETQDNKTHKKYLPLPWGTRLSTTRHTLYAIDADGFPVTHSPNHDEINDIVESVNSHAALKERVKELEAFANDMVGMLRYNKWDLHYMRDRIKEIESLLSKTKTEKQ
jgi:hypothetical protein